MASCKSYTYEIEPRTYVLCRLFELDDKWRKNISD